jgi:hypothetical protein
VQCRFRLGADTSHASEQQAVKLSAKSLGCSFDGAETRMGGTRLGPAVARHPTPARRECKQCSTWHSDRAQQHTAAPMPYVVDNQALVDKTPGNGERVVHYSGTAGAQYCHSRVALRGGDCDDPLLTARHPILHFDFCICVAAHFSNDIASLRESADGL